MERAMGAQPDPNAPQSMQLSSHSSTLPSSECERPATWEDLTDWEARAELALLGALFGQRTAGGGR